MSKGISYPIQGRYNPKGEKDAIKGIQSISKAAKAFNFAVGGFVVAKVFQGINKVVSGSTEIFSQQNKALVNYHKAISNSSKLSMDSLENLNQTMDKLSRNNFFDGDALNNAAALAANMGLNEEQMKNVLSAATDLAAATGQDLSQAVKTLTLSYSGNVTQLARISPEIKNLTKEQLANGEAVKLISEQYKGFADTMANTFSGRDTQFANTFSDLQASFGGIGQALKFGLEGKLLEPLNKITEWVENNRNQIIKFFYAIPEIIKSLALNSWEIIKQTFTGEGMKNLFSFLGQSLLIVMKASLKTTFELIKGLFSDLLTLLDFVFGNTWRKLEDLCGKLGNKVIEVLNTAFQKVLSAPGVKQLYEWLSGNKVSDLQVITFKFKTDNAKDNISFKDVTNTFNQNFKNLINTYKTEVKNGIADESKALQNFTSFYSKLTDKAVSDIKEILSKDLPEDVKQAMVAGIVEANYETSSTSDNSITSTGSVDSAVSSATNGISSLMSLIQTFGEVGQAVAIALSENWIGLILMLIAKLVSALQNSSENFNAFIESISMIMAIVADSIAPIIEEIIQPFLDSMKSVGNIIASILNPALEMASAIITPLMNLTNQLMQILAPIVGVIGTLLSLFISLNPLINIFAAIIKIMGDILKAVYNFILVPVVNFLLTLITSIGNFFIRMYNGVVGVLNDISIFGWHPFDFSKKSELNYDEMALEKIQDYETYNSDDFSHQPGSSDSGKSGNSASYTAARDIYINIYYSNSYVNGDAREIALNLRNEIRAAEKLGY